MNDNPNVNSEEHVQENFATATRLINEIVDSSIPSSSCQSPVAPPGLSTSKIMVPSVHTFKSSHSEQQEFKPTLELYRAMGQFSESQSDVNVSNVGLCVARLNEILTSRPATPLPGVPPSYSTVIKQGRPSLDIRRDVRSMEMQHLSAFARVPPPSYSEIHGVWSRDMSNASSEQILLGPDPIYIWCARCATVVVTSTHAQRSKFTHLTAAALCLFGCWPCALLPYCMNSCKNIYHYCPDCNYLFGMYRPW